MLTSEDRRMTVTPLDLRQAKFSTAMRGFDRTEVTNLLVEASAGYEEALRENERLRQQIAQLDASLAQFRDLESGLKSTLMSAQKVAEDMRDTAQQDAARIVREAEGKAAMLLQKAQARLDEVQREIDGLRLKRREAETSIEATISALHSTLEFVREQDTRTELAAIR
jgi:cell division initiation protein